MTLREAESATDIAEGWHILRPNGEMVVSSHRRYEKAPVCRIAIDATTQRVTNTSTGPVQAGDWPTL